MSDFPEREYCRQQLLKQLDEWTAPGRGQEPFALLVFNLQKFRELNIDYGHAAGDQVLAQVAKRIGSVLRPDDLLFHIGNDEFAVLLTSLRTLQVVQLAAVKILDSISANFEIAGQLISVSALSGGAVFPDHATDRDGLLNAADAAMKYAREHELAYSLESV